MKSSLVFYVNFVRKDNCFKVNILKTRCARQLLFPVYVASREKAEVLSSFSPITIPLIALLCLIFSKKYLHKYNIQIHREQASLPQSFLHQKSLQKMSVYLNQCFYVLINCSYFLYYFGSISTTLQGFKQKISFAQELTSQFSCRFQSSFLQLLFAQGLSCRLMLVVFCLLECLYIFYCHS